MRSVVFVERLEFEFPGNVFPNAVVLGDVDNDKKDELVVGNLEGDLHIFKGSNAKPWGICSDLGMITCIGIGDICSSGKNCLVTISGEGFCHIFCSEPDKQDQSDSEIAHHMTMSPCHVQHLPANIKAVLIDDIDGDGKMEIVVGHTDRVVRAYRWAQKQTSTTESSSFIPGKFVLLQVWHLNGQIGSISLSTHPGGGPKLIVSQPGCNYAELLCSWVKGQEEVPNIPSSSSKGECYVKWHPVTNKRARNANVSTELVGKIRCSVDRETADDSRGEQLTPDRMAMCTLDGTLMMIEEDKILWSLLVDHQLFRLTKCDINCDGQDEVVVCAWDGQTYIVDHSQELVRFHFQENVCAFCAGQYSTTGTNKPCLVYVTFNKRIYIYWNVQLPRIPSADLQQVLLKNESVRQKLHELSIDETDMCTSKLRELYQWCFYGNHSKSATEKT